MLCCQCGTSFSIIRSIHEVPWPSLWVATTEQATDGEFGGHLGDVGCLEVEPLGMLLVVSAMSERLRSKFELAAFLRGNGINLDVSCIEARADDDFW